MKKEATNPEAYEAPNAELFTIVLESGILDGSIESGGNDDCLPVSQ